MGSNLLQSTLMIFLLLVLYDTHFQTPRICIRVAILDLFGEKEAEKKYIVLSLCSRPY